MLFLTGFAANKDEVAEHCYYSMSVSQIFH